MRFIVFGYDLNLSAGGSQPLKMGGSAVATISNESDKRIRITFTKAITLAYSGSYQLDIASGVIMVIDLLTPTASSISGQITFIGWGYPVTNILPVIDEGTIYFSAKSDDIDKKIFKDYLRNTFLSYLNIIGFPGPATKFFRGFAPDLRNQTVEIFTKPFNAEIQDIIDEVTHIQKVAVKKIVLANDSVNLRLTPLNEFVYLNPDILTNFDHGTKNSDFVFIQYQFALVNGELSLDISDLKRTLNWKRKTFADGEVGMLMLKYSDENGCPLCISFDDKNGGEILYRDGNMELLAASSTFPNNEFQKTIRGISVGPITGTLRSIAFNSVDFEKREQQLYGINRKTTTQTDLLSQPFWLSGTPTQKIVKLEATAPAMITGLTRGAWLTNLQPKNPAAAVIVMDPVELTGNPIPDIYHLHTLQLNNQNWGLNSAFEEKESLALSGGGPIPPPIQSRSFIAPASLAAPIIDSFFEIPATDIHFGATNIYFPKTLAGGTTVIETEIVKKVAGKLEDINTVFRTFSFKPDSQEHISKFHRRYNISSEKPSALFHNLPVVTSSPAQFERPPVPFSNPLLTETGDVVSADTSASLQTPLFFIHGRKTQPAVSPLAVAPLITLTADIEQKIKELQRIWNEGGFLLEQSNDPAIKKIALAVRTIRHYLDGVIDAEPDPHTRVAFQKSFYRMQLGVIAKTDGLKREILKKAKAYIEGNLNALPGLGLRLQALKTWLDRLKTNEDEANWDIARFKTDWDTGIANWATATAEQQLLNTLFDHVYKQADRELIANLVVFVDGAAALSDKFKEVKAAAVEFEAYFKDIFTTSTIPDRLKSVLTDAFQGIDPYVKKLQTLWDDPNWQQCMGLSSAQVKARYGKYFDLHTYKKILSDNDQRVIDCLEKRLRTALKKEFIAIVDGIITEIIKHVDTYADALLATYEEDILALFMMVEDTSKFLDDNAALISALKAVDTPDKLKAAFKALIPDLRKKLYDHIREYMLKHYGRQLDMLAAIPDNVIEALVDNYGEQILVVMKLIDEYKEWKDNIIPAYVAFFNRATASIRSILKNITRKDVLLALLKSYLLEKHGFNISLADLRVDPPQYIVYSKQVAFNIDPSTVAKFNAILSKLHLDSYQLCELNWDFMFSDQAVYILKLGNDMTAEDILNDINIRNRKPGAPVGPLGDITEYTAYFHSEIIQRGWRGLIILNPVADISKHRLIADLAGKSHIKMKYAAIGGAESITNGLDVYARVMEANDVMDTPDKGDDAKFTLVKFDATIKNTQLETGDITFILNFKNIFGKESNFDKIIIKGVVPKKQAEGAVRDFKFTAQLEQPKVFNIETAFLDQLTIRGISAERKNDKSVLEIDGSLTFRSFGTGTDIQIIDGQNQVSLKNFRLNIPEQPAGSSTRMGIPRGVGIEFSAIEFVFSQPRPINFGFMEILPKGISYYRKFDPAEQQTFIQDKIWITAEPGSGHGFTCLHIKLDFGKLTAMGGSGVGSLEMSGILGFTLESSSLTPYFALNAVNGKEITIDIFRFITLYIQTLIIATAKLKDAGDDVTYIKAENAQIKLLGWSPLGDDGKFSILHVQKKPKEDEKQKSPVTGFLAVADKKNSTDGDEQSWNVGALKIFWVFIARNLKFSNDNLVNILIDPGGAAGDDEQDGILKKLGIFKDASPDLQNLSFANDDTWLFAASFAVANFLERCTIIFQDQHFYGIMLFSKELWFQEVFGKQKLALAYMPGPTKEQDKFRIEFGLPALNFLGRLQSGLVALEYGLNRDFLIDFGFPWRTGNSYLWSRTFALRGGVYETRFGFYFQKKTQVIQTPGSDVAIKYLTIGAGVGIYYGYYVGCRNTFAWAEAGIGITVVLAGEVTLKTSNSLLPNMNSSIYKIQVTGIIGIYAYAEGGIDYWIFSASIRAEVVAALAGTLIYLPEGNSSLTFEAVLSVKFNASATIKLGFIRKTFHISGHLDYGVSGRVALN